MSKSTKFSPAVRERAVEMVEESRGENPSLLAAIDPSPSSLAMYRMP